MQFRPLAVLLAAALPALALAANDVPLPRERPDPAVATRDAASSSVPVPRERPGEIAAADAASSSSAASSAEPAASSEASSGSAAASSSSAEPAPLAPAEPPAPPRDYQVACPAIMTGHVTGKVLPPIHDGQCGIQTPLELSAVTANGRSIKLNAKIITDCGMAVAFPAWVEEVDSYVKAHDKTQIDTINLSTSYQCRNVDNAKTGNLSFHAFADALDIMGFSLEDGRTISIAPGFNGTPEQGRDILHFARDAACTHFMTVLSPDADSYHQDNMHLDLACHGKMCTARLCE
jgi:hypothetical protein